MSSINRLPFIDWNLQTLTTGAPAKKLHEIERFAFIQ